MACTRSTQTKIAALRGESRNKEWTFDKINTRAKLIFKPFITLSSTLTTRRSPALLTFKHYCGIPSVILIVIITSVYMGKDALYTFRARRVALKGTQPLHENKMTTPMDVPAITRR